jgi:hypothetical protein
VKFAMLPFKMKYENEGVEGFKVVLTMRPSAGGRSCWMKSYVPKELACNRRALASIIRSTRKELRSLYEREKYAA